MGACSLGGASERGKGEKARTRTVKGDNMAAWATRKGAVPTRRGNLVL